MSSVQFQKPLWRQAALRPMLSEGFDATTSGYHKETYVWCATPTSWRRYDDTFADPTRCLRAGDPG